MEKFNSRKLTDNELSYMYFQELANPYFEIFMECEEIHNIDFIEKSINQVLQHFIELNSEIVNKKYVYKKQNIQIKIIENNFDGYNFEDLQEKLENKNSVIEVYIINKKHILFRFNHSFIDGKGAFLFIRALMQIINRQMINIDTTCYIGDIDFVKDLPKNKEKRNLFYNNKLVKKSMNKSNENYYKRLTINKNIPFALSKILVIMSKYFKNTNLTYLLPTDIRHFNKDIISISNLVEPLYLRCKKDDSWIDISKKIHNDINTYKNINLKNMKYGIILKMHPLFFKILIKVSCTIQNLTNRFLTSGSITNIISNISEYSSKDLVVKSVFVKPFYQPLVPFVIEIIEQKNKMEIIFASNTNYIDFETANEILNDIKKLEN